MKYGFFKTKRIAVKHAKEWNKPVFDIDGEYFVGDRPQALYRLNLKKLVTGKVKRIKVK